VDDAEQVVEEVDEELQRVPLVHRLMEKLPTVVLQYIPIAGPALSASLDAIYADRLRTFYTELADGEHELTPGLIDSEDFLHAYFATVQAAARTKHRDKIRAFARLLRAAAREETLQQEGNRASAPPLPQRRRQPLALPTRLIVAPAFRAAIQTRQ
jgi:hypothetical protein